MPSFVEGLMYARRCARHIFSVMEKYHWLLPDLDCDSDKVSINISIS